MNTSNLKHKETEQSLSGTFPLAFKVSLPVFFGYLAIGVAFGLLLENAGYPIFLAPLMSVLIYGGAAQYLAVDFFVNNARFLEIFSVILLINSRHMIYGLSFLDRYSLRRWYRPYLIFSLTDETWSVLSATRIPEGMDKNRVYFYVSALNHSYWILGSLLGAFFGHWIDFNVAGLEFSLTALFIVLLLEQFKNTPSKLPFLIATVCGIASILFVEKNNMLLVAILSSLFLLSLFRKVLPTDDVNQGITK